MSAISLKIANLLSISFSVLFGLSLSLDLLFMKVEKNREGIENKVGEGVIKET